MTKKPLDRSEVPDWVAHGSKADFETWRHGQATAKMHEAIKAAGGLQAMMRQPMVGATMKAQKRKPKVGCYFSENSMKPACKLLMARAEAAEAARDAAEGALREWEEAERLYANSETPKDAARVIQAMAEVRRVLAAADKRGAEST